MNFQNVPWFYFKVFIVHIWLKPSLGIHPLTNFILPGLASEVLIADSRVKDIELHDYRIVNRITATTIPDLDEFKEFSDVKVYRSNL